MKYITFIFLLAFVYSENASKQMRNIETLSIDQKIGQLFAIAVPLSSPRSVLKKYCETINYYAIGSVLLDRPGTINQQITTVNYLQKHCTIKPLIIQDLEYGLSMRLYDGLRFPKAITCGAIQDNSLIYRMACEIGRECKLLGVDINTAPVVDILCNDQNVMKERSFGQDKENVLNKARMYIDGLMSQNVHPCIKHFPGLGATINDPHLELPTLPFSKEILFARELYPFAQLAHITPCIMSAHMCVPAYDSRTNYSATLSHNIITDLLKKELKFDGIIITDALRMEALTKHFNTATLAYESFKAGNDILLCPQPIAEAINAIKNAIEAKKISEQELDTKVTKILQAKNKLNVYDKRTFDKKTIDEQVTEKLFTNYAKELKKELFFAALTLLDSAHAIPVSQLCNLSYVQIGGMYNSALITELQKYYPELSSIILENTPRGCDINELLYQMEYADTVIISLFNLNSDQALNFGIAPNALTIINKIAKTKNIILVICGSPYCLKLFEHIPTIILAYEDDPDAQEAAAQTITGIFKPTGKLPVTISSRFVLGMGN